MSINHDISKLDDLIVTTIDSVKGYEHSADHVDRVHFADLFRGMAAERRAIAARLQARSRALGGSPADYGSAAATLHRRWDDLRRALGDGDTGAIEEIERGEAYLREEFRRVVDDAAMSDESRALVAGCYDRILEAADRLHALKRETELAD